MRTRLRILAFWLCIGSMMLVSSHELIGSNDIAIESLDFDTKLIASSCLSGSIKNLGSTNLYSFDLKWQVDGGMVFTKSYYGLNVAPMATFDFSTGQPVNWLTPGSIASVTMWTAAPNGFADTNPANNSASAAPLVIKGVTSGDKRVLLEEFSGAWCGWCPDGAYVKDTIVDNHPDEVYAVTIHSGDAMAFFEGQIIKSAYPVVFPGGLVDRIQFEGTNTPSLPRAQWAQRVNEQLAKQTAMCISLVNFYNSATRQLTVTVYAEVLDYLPAGDYRINVYVLEDRVTGTGSGYNQNNYFSNNPSYPNHPLFSDPSPIVGYEHNRTLRAVISGDAWGDNAVIPSSPVPGTYSKSYTYSIPVDYDHSEMSVIAFISRHSGSIANREVYNAIRAGLSGVALNTCSESTVDACQKSYFPSEVTATFTPPKEVKLGIKRGKALPGNEPVSTDEPVIYPNPTYDRLNIRIYFEEEKEVVIDVYNHLGQQVVTSGVMPAHAGTNTYFVDSGRLNEGVYRVVLRAEGKVIHSRQISVLR